MRFISLRSVIQNVNTDNYELTFEREKFLKYFNIFMNEGEE